MIEKRCAGGISRLGLILLASVSYYPVAAAGQHVIIGWQVTGSGSQSGNIDTNLDWDVINANPLTTYSWNLMSPIYIDLGAGVGTATIDGLSIGVKADPFIDFGFSARSADGPTHFTFSSQLLIVNPALINAQGSAWAQVIPGFGNSVVSGDFGSKVYHSVYNGGTVFADLVTAPIYGYGYEVAPSQLIPGQVSSMQAQWGFTVSAGGQASGNSHYQIMGDTIPEPASMLLLGLGSLALIRKRKF
jgi:hypothetical protein